MEGELGHGGSAEVCDLGGFGGLCAWLVFLGKLMAEFLLTE